MHPLRVALVAAVVALVGAVIACATIPDPARRRSPGARRAPQGQQGPQGQRGPSDLWHDGGYGFTQSISNAGFVTLASVTVGAGSYFIQASVNLANTGPSAASYGCDLVDGGGELHFAPAETPNGTQDATQLTFTALLSPTGSDAISLRCDSPDLDSVAANRELDALQVGTVH